MNNRNVVFETESKIPLIRNRNINSFGEMDLRQRGTGMTLREWREWVTENYGPTKK